MWILSSTTLWQLLREDAERCSHCLCSAPIEWETPNGQTAQVNLQLQFGAFFGYGQAEDQPGYLGLQCHGLLWPVMDSELPHYWPIAPPVISGKVRCMTAGTAPHPQSVRREIILSADGGGDMLQLAGTAGGKGC